MAVHEKTPVRQQTLSVLVENRSGVLSHISGLFSARGFNIDSLAVGETQDPTMSRITLVVTGDQKTIEQIKKQLNKLIDVIKVQEITEDNTVNRELMLVKFKTTPKLKESLRALVGERRIRVIEENPDTTVVECTESRQNAKKFFELFDQIGILEIARTGTVALSRELPKSLVTPVLPE